MSGEKFRKVLNKSLALGSRPTEESFPELPDVLIWFRFMLAIVYGLYLGFNDVRSGVMPLQALNLICFVPLVYARMYLGAEQDQFVTEVIFAGTFNAVALVLLIWIYFFTAAHADEEGKMMVFLVAQPDSDPVVTEEPGPSVVEESEF